MKESQHRSIIRNHIRAIMQERARAGSLSPRKINVSWPVYDEREILSAMDSLLDLRISQGERVREFEKDFARYVGTRFAVAVNSGSSANLLALAALMAAGEVSKGAEVIVPAATFATVASPVLQLGLKPVYVDVGAHSWNIDPCEIEKAISKKTRIIMPVHSFGNPADMAAIMRMARKHKLLVLEDCCEAHGSRIGARMVGSFGDLGTYSFFVAHNMTTGEGGMVCTNQKKYYDLLTSLREFGRLPQEKLQRVRFWRDPVLGEYDARQFFVRLGYNMRMTDIAASLGIEQLKKLDRMNDERLRIVGTYQRVLEKYRCFLRLPEIRSNTRYTFYGYTVVVEKGVPFRRKDLAEFLESQGIETRTFFAGCLPDQPAFRSQPKRVVGTLPVARWIRDNAIFIGCHPALSPAQVASVTRAFETFFSRYPSSNI